MTWTSQFFLTEADKAVLNDVPGKSTNGDVLIILYSAACHPKGVCLRWLNSHW